MTADDLLPDDPYGSSQPSLAGMRTILGPTRVKPRWRRLRSRSCEECYRGARKIRALRREADCRAAARRIASRQDRDQSPSSRASVGAVATVAIVRVGVTGQCEGSWSSGLGQVHRSGAADRRVPGGPVVGDGEDQPGRGHRHPDGLTAGQYRPTPSANSAPGAAIGGIRVFEEWDDRPDHRTPTSDPRPAPRSECALVQPNSGLSASPVENRALVGRTTAAHPETANWCAEFDRWPLLAWRALQLPGHRIDQSTSS